MSRALVVLGLAGVVLEAGCGWIWVISPQLTAIYNPEFTAEFFARMPWLGVLLEGALRMLGSPGKPPQDVLGMVVRLEIGLMVMTVGYVAALLVLASASDALRSSAFVVLGCALVFRLTMMLLPGMFSTDLFSYVMYGRIASVYSQNPYVLAPNSFGADPFLSWVFPFWRDQPSVYGALWTDFSWALSGLRGGLSNFDQVMVYRLSLGAMELATVGLLWWLLGKLKTGDGSARARTTALVLYAWNPVVLFDLVGSAHNDVAMLALLLVGVALLTGRFRGHWLWGLAVLTLSALIKYATGLLVPLWAAAWAARATSMRRRVIRLATGLGISLALAIVLWWPWLQTSQAFLPLGDAAGGKLVINSAPDLVALTVADQLLVPAGMEPELAQAAARFWIRAIVRAVFAVYLIWELRRLWTMPASADQPVLRAVLEASTRVLLVLPLLVMTWVWSWYFSWSLVLAALLGWRSGLARLVVTYTLVAGPVVYAHQYLNQEFSGVFVLLLALGPLLGVLFAQNVGKIRRARLLVDSGSEGGRNT